MRYIIREKLFHLADSSVIQDEHGAPLYEVKGKLFSLHHTLVLMDLAGNELATVNKQIISMTPKFHITRHGEEAATVRKKLISPFVDRFTVDIPGPDDLHVTGSVFEHNFTIERRGTVVATVSKRWVSLTDTYGVDTTAGEDDILILAVVLAIDLTEDAERARAND
ncbi:MAG TPA: LURP-one-related family protein [Bryobacteraceae bacterium]|jgi:uncharacterized protein YxjI|nr:LURP-one-related family protein [Bryobacteraceae bacterium]